MLLTPSHRKRTEVDWFHHLENTVNCKIHTKAIVTIFIVIKLHQYNIVNNKLIIPYASYNSQTAISYHFKEIQWPALLNIVHADALAPSSTKPSADSVLTIRLIKVPYKIFILDIYLDSHNITINIIITQNTPSNAHPGISGQSSR